MENPLILSKDNITQPKIAVIKHFAAFFKEVLVDDIEPFFYLLIYIAPYEIKLSLGFLNGFF